MFGSESGSLDRPGYQIPQSLTIAARDNAHFTRTSLTGNQIIWTFSGWFKMTVFGANREIIASNSGNTFNELATVRFAASNQIQVRNITAGTQTSLVVSDGPLTYTVGRWFHLVATQNTENPEAADRVKIFVDGVRQPVLPSAVYPPFNYAIGRLNRGVAHRIGRDSRSDDIAQADYYIAEFVQLNGVEVGPEVFGENHRGVWRPKDISGLDYNTGPTSFRLDFSDENNLGNDVSGQGIHWVPQSFQAARKTSDSPTNNQVMLDSTGFSSIPLNEGNLLLSGGTGQWPAYNSTFPIPDEGAYYMEIIEVSSAPLTMVGICTLTETDWVLKYGNTGNIFTPTRNDPSTPGWAVSTRVGCSYDTATNTIAWWYDGVLNYSETYVRTQPMYFNVAHGSNNNVSTRIRFNPDGLLHLPPGFTPLLPPD